jgi:rhodanese-related sulfurtransferase
VAPWVKILMTDLPMYVDVQSVKDLLDTGEDFLLLDCREPDEHAIVRIAGSKLLPMNETPTRIGELEPYRGKRIIVHCHHGKRSMQVTQWLRGQGFSKVQSMTGGIHLWSLLIDTSLPRY